MQGTSQTDENQKKKILKLARKNDRSSWLKTFNLKIRNYQVQKIGKTSFPVLEENS